MDCAVMSVRHQAGNPFVRTTHSPNKYPQRQIGVRIEVCISILYEITKAKLVLSIENYLHTGGKYRIKNFEFIRGSLRTISIYTDGQKKRCSKSLTCIACDSKARAAQTYHDQNLEPSIWFNLICQLCLPGMLAIYTYTY